MQSVNYSEGLAAKGLPEGLAVKGLPEGQAAKGLLEGRILRHQLGSLTNKINIIAIIFNGLLI